MPDVFISHSSHDRRDKMVADAICAKLEERGIRCWIAPRDVPPGSTWAASIVDAVAGSQVMVLVFSAEANKSPHVMREVERAVSKGVSIIPFRIDDVVPSKAMEFFISSSHWLDAMTPPVEAHIARLATTVESLIHGVQAETARSSSDRAPVAGTSALTDPDFDPLLFGKVFKEEAWDADWLKTGKALCREGKLVRAAQMYRTTAKTAERMAAADPSGANFQTWFFVHSHLAHVLSMIGDLPHALEEYRRARQICERAETLASTEGSHSSFRANAVHARVATGDLLWRTGKPDEALVEYRAGVAAAKRHRDHYGDDFSAPDQVWWISSKIGDVLAQQHDTAGAIAAYREALDAGNAMSEFKRNLPNWQQSALEIQQRIERLEAATT